MKYSLHFKRLALIITHGRDLWGLQNQGTIKNYSYDRKDDSGLTEMSDTIERKVIALLWRGSQESLLLILM